MKLVSYKCPNCNASIQVDDSKRSFFCTYCGSPVNIDLGENVFTYREINEAEIRRAEAEENIQLSKLEYKLKKKELQEKRNKEILEQNERLMKPMIIFIGIMLAFFILVFVFAK
ncbi:MAG: hypothetical protein WBK46_10920 [Ruminococcus flavefaciens]